MRKMNFLLTFLMVFAMLPLFSQTKVSPAIDSQSFDFGLIKHFDIAYCDASTEIHSEYIAKVLLGGINNSSLWQGGVADYTSNIAYIMPAQSKTINVFIGDPYFTDRVSCWVDWNMDYVFDSLPQLHEEFVLENHNGTGELFFGAITVPAITPDGYYRMRVRLNFSTLPIPCGVSSYGEVEDYTIRVGDTLTNDVCVVSLDMDTLYPTGFVLPKARVKNLGVLTQDFDVVLNIGSYSSTKTVAGLATGHIEQITFDNWFATAGAYTAEVCTELADDEYAMNDCKTNDIVIAGGNYAIGFNYGSAEDSIVKFSLNNPADVFNYAPIESSELISAAGWVDYSLCALATDGALYAVDNQTGAMTFVAYTSATRGIAYDGNRFYGCSDTQLFEIDPETGQEVLIGDMEISGSMDGIACDLYGTLYGVGSDISSLFSINKITGTATVIGNLGFSFSEAIDISFDKENNICYLSSNDPNYEEGLYMVDVFTGVATHYYSYPDNIRIYGFAIPYTNFPPAGPAPEGFMANYEDGMGVQCAWGYPPPEQWIGYDDGVNNDGLGSDGGGTYWGAIRFEPEDLFQYDNSMITKVAFFPRKFATASEMTLMIWVGPEAANLIYEQTMSGLNWNAWNEVELNLGYYIDASTELWIGFKVVHLANEYPLGYDFGPAVAGYGDLVSFDGISWETLSGYGLDFNFNLKAFVVENEEVSVMGKTIIQTLPISNPGGKLIAGNLNPAMNSSFAPADKNLLGYNVYRDNAQINTGIIPPTSQEYLDDFHIPGNYFYSVRSVYEAGLSDHSNPATVTISGATIEVEPDSIVEIHNNPPQITTQTLTISNNGNETLIWEIPEWTNFRELNYANNVGVTLINSPTSGLSHTNAEPVIFTIKNLGDATLSRIPWEIFWDGPTGSDTLAGIYIPELVSNAEVEIEAGTANISMFGSYSFVACTQLPEDEFPDDDCKTKWIFGPSYCDASTQTEDEWIANVFFDDFFKSSGWQGGVADYTDLFTSIPSGSSKKIKVTNGNAWASDFVVCWVDWNNDFEWDVSAGTNEMHVLENIDGMGEYFIGDITPPLGTPPGMCRMRVRMTYSGIAHPCASSSYGEVEDYNILVTAPVPNTWLDFDMLSGSIPAGQSMDIQLYFNSENLANYTYSDEIQIMSNDINSPLVTVAVSLIVTPPILNAPVNLAAEMQNANDVLLSWEAPEGIKYATDNKAGTKNNLPSYNIYRENEMIAIGIFDTIYLDEELPWGWYHYYLTAVIDGWESEPSNSVLIRVMDVIPDPPQNLQYEIMGDSVYLSWQPPPSGDFDYYWIYRNGVQIGLSEDEEHYDPLPPAFPVEYYVTAFCYNSGESDSSNHVIVVAPGISEQEAMIRLFPNPANESLIIQSDQDLISIEIYNAHGESVLRRLLFGKKQQINTSAFKPGIYTIRLEIGKGIVVRKLIVR